MVPRALRLVAGALEQEAPWIGETVGRAVVGADAVPVHRRHRRSAGAGARRPHAARGGRVAHARPPGARGRVGPGRPARARGRARHRRRSARRSSASRPNAIERGPVEALGVGLDAGADRRRAARQLRHARRRGPDRRSPRRPHPRRRRRARRRARRHEVEDGDQRTRRGQRARRHRAPAGDRPARRGTVVGDPRQRPGRGRATWRRRWCRARRTPPTLRRAAPPRCCTASRARAREVLRDHPVNRKRVASRGSLRQRGPHPRRRPAASRGRGRGGRTSHCG